jgi:uncharacterized protein (TIGR02001 family)
MRLFMSSNRRDEGQQSLAGARRAGFRARILLVSAAMLAAQAARAQTSASASLVSEYSVRGVSLSDRSPSPQFSLAWDSPQGWYAGAFAAARLQLGAHSGVTQLLAYAGYARRLASGLSWEAGVNRSTFRNASEYDYGEMYAGLASDRISGRIYLSPDYYGYRGRTAYAELNAFHPLGERIKLIGHVGVLHGFNGTLAEAQDRVDLRLAIGFDAGPCNFQLAWLHSTTTGPGAERGKREPQALAVSASYSF